MLGLPLFASRRNSFLQMVLIAVPLVLLLTFFSQSVFAKNTYVITDGEQVTVHRTYIADPAKVLEEAGVEADSHEYRVSQRKEHVYDITVVRDDMVVIINCGQRMYVAIEDSTVGALLARANIPVEDGYVVSCDLNAKAVDGMIITVNYQPTQPEDAAEATEPLINNGVAVFPTGEVLSCYELEGN